MDSTGTLTLNQATVTAGTVTDNGTLNLTGSAVLKNGSLGNTHQINVSGTGNALDKETVTNTGNIDVSGALLVDQISTLDNTGGGSITVDFTGTLTLNQATISGGTINDFTPGSPALGGLINVTGNSRIDSGAKLNNGAVTVQSGQTLTLDNVTVTGTSFTDSGTVLVDGSATLTLNQATIDGGTVTNTGSTIDLIGTDVLKNGHLGNSGQINVSGTGNALDKETITNTGNIDVSGALTIDQVSTLDNTGGSITVDFTGTLTLNQATISGGTINDFTPGSPALGGLINVTGNSTINGGAMLNNGAVTVQNGQTLTLDNVTVTGTSFTDSGTVLVDSGATLTLNSATITGGTVTDNGTIYAITTVDISGNIIGTGAIDISNLAQLEIGGSVASTNTVFFQGSQGELILDHSKQFSGLITGSSVGTILTLDDEIDLRDLPFTNNMSETTSYNSSLNISTVTFSDGVTANNIAIQLSGNYTNQGWKFVNDGYGPIPGTLVQLSPPPVFSDIIPGGFSFTGDKTTPGNQWTFQAAVTDDDANVIGQGGITKFDLYDTHLNVTTLLGSATFAGGTWTVSGIVASVSYDGGIYTLTTTATTAINNNDTVEITAFDAGNSSASKSVTLTNNSSFNVVPAGIAGDPINLALTDPSGDQPTGPIHLTFTGVPSDWSINEGTNLGNGTWTVETNDLSALTVTTAAAYTGAMVLGVTETWKNADGSTGIAVVSDNVEAYAPGSPIFALSGNDTLTGGGGNDLFVFAQPIGHDTVYSFDAAHDQVDLIGYAGFTSFADVQSHLTEDANGDALITLGDGQSIELQGVHAAALTQSNFVFDQMPTLDNAGTMTIGDGAVMPLSGTINNTGTIALSSTGDETNLQLIEHGVTFEGGGQIVLSDSDANVISGTSSNVTLDNEDNTISGAGRLGNGELTLTNAGTIDATGTHALTIDTGSNSVLNSGVLEASGSGGMTVASSIVNSGVLWANGASLTVQGAVSGNGTATIDGSGTLDFEASSSANVVFGSGATGTLRLGDSFHFNGTITGFAASDTIDLANIGSAGASISYLENAAGTGGTLAISSGAQTVLLSLIGHYATDDFSIVPDHATGTVVTLVPHDLHV